MIGRVPHAQRVIMHGLTKCIHPHLVYKLSEISDKAGNITLAAYLWEGREYDGRGSKLWLGSFVS